MKRRVSLLLCDLRYRIMRLLVSAKGEQKSSYLSEREKTDFNENTLSQEMSWLEEQLKRTPYWFQGVVKIAHLRLTARDFRGCYDACQVAKLLEMNEKERRLTREVLSTLYLRLGEFEKVKELLMPICEGQAASTVEQELLAAAHMGLEEYEQAADLFDHFESSGIGGRTRPILEYAEQKKSPSG